MTLTELHCGIFHFPAFSEAITVFCLTFSGQMVALGHFNATPIYPQAIIKKMDHKQQHVIAIAAAVAVVMPTQKNTTIHHQ